MPWGMDNLQHFDKKSLFPTENYVYSCSQFLSIQEAALAAV